MTRDEALDRLQRLSERELQVAVAISNGQQPREIAKRYRLSVKTVSTYRARIMEKLRLPSNAHLIVILYKAGKVKLTYEELEPIT